MQEITSVSSSISMELWTWWSLHPMQWRCWKISSCWTGSGLWWPFFLLAAHHVQSKYKVWKQACSINYPQKKLHTKHFGCQEIIIIITEKLWTKPMGSSSGQTITKTWEGHSANKLHRWWTKCYSVISSLFFSHFSFMTFSQIPEVSSNLLSCLAEAWDLPVTVKTQISYLWT